MPQTQPNVVLIMSDQHNSRVMGCAGDAVVRTPNLDALAAGGVRFTNSYCPYPLCVPSRMGFMTGRYPSEVNAWDNGSVLASDAPTFAHCLGAAGYEATLCGRMHFVGPDQFHGFERRLVGDVGGWTLAPEIVGSGRRRTNGQTSYAVQVSGYGRTGFQAFDREVTRLACEFIAGRRAGDRPFCLVVGFILPHNPLICSKDLFDYYMDAIGQAPSIPEETLSRLHPAMRKWRERRGVDDLTPEQNLRGMAAYYGLVTELDRNIGRIMESIDAANTVVVYCSDHGDMACEQGMWWKSSFYDGSARVPCVFSWPGVFGEGAEVGAVASLIDVGPTLLDIVGADPIPDATGRSFASFLTGDARPDWPDEVFCEYLGLLGDQPAYMVRTGKWKLNYYGEFGSYQLFDMEEDPLELDDLRDEPGLRHVAEALLARVHARWSVSDTLERAGRQMRAREAVVKCGHALFPHEIPVFTPPAGSSEFDFSQLPE